MIDVIPAEQLAGTLDIYRCTYDEDVEKMKLKNVALKVLNTIKAMDKSRFGTLYKLQFIYENFVLDCYKGRKFAAEASRPARSHAAFAMIGETVMNNSG